MVLLGGRGRVVAPEPVAQADRPQRASHAGLLVQCRLSLASGGGLAPALCRNFVMNIEEQFIERHKDSEFRLKDELFAKLSSGECVLDYNPEGQQSSLPCSHFLHIYRRRAEHLRRFDAPHAQRLREDALALCEELAKTPDEICRLWVFSLPPYSDYTVFEGAESGRILGCLFTVDKRLAPSDEWERLWHGERGSI